MGNDTSIEWTDATWNPVRGCSRVSPGCVNCYAEKVAARFSGPGLAYEGLARRTLLTVKGENVHRGRWTGDVRMVPEHLADPLRWTKPRRIFVNSMSDLFHEKLSNEDIAAVFGVMAAAPRHTFQVLTKRAERMRDWFKWAEMDGDNPGPFTALLEAAVEASNRLYLDDVDTRDAFTDRIMPEEMMREGAAVPWPLPNVWLGVSVEDQQRADERIPLLLQTPAAVRFISYEPALGPVDVASISDAAGGQIKPLVGLHWVPGRDGAGAPGMVLRGGKGPHLDWVIVGGESGPGARPFNVAWARRIVAQCKAAGVACFVKQLGAEVRWNGNAPAGGWWPSTVDARESTSEPEHAFLVKLRSKKGGDMAEWPEDLRVREFPT